jgi:hypothetical protein
MGKRSDYPDLRHAEDLSLAEIDREIARLRKRVGFRRGGSALHQTTRLLANWEHVRERRFGIRAPSRPNRN